MSFCIAFDGDISSDYTAFNVDIGKASGSAITPFERSETRLTYSLGFGAGISLAESFWFRTDFGFLDYINKDYDEIFTGD